MTDYYLEFYSGQGGALQIRPGGTDFFRDAREQVLAGVAETDLNRVRGALEKEALERWIGREESLTLSFDRQVAGTQRRYCLQTIRTRGSDDHHIVIGLRPES